MAVRVLGLIELQDASAFAEYRRQVGLTVTQYGGHIAERGTCETALWNELNCAPFSAYVELQFPTSADVKRWAQSPEYLALIPIRNQAIKLTLFSLLAA
jgi:uncharacterized protein (DUF1330 family)